ncbi:CheR family methyltransferase [Deinococcus sp. JMULE3]|uniref:CheR family methyltransferase n=1 Tax=Deinococcus sp. JMULE3 TaxID=2518341 RepID=UPI001576A970
MKFDELLERTAGLRWNAPLERLAGTRLQRLAAPHGSLADLARLAEARADVAADVAAAFTVGETWFHRFGEQLDAAALALRALDRPARLWSAGCSTGEEAYALLGACLRAGVDARVLGTDLNPDSVAAAAGGVYPLRALRDAPPDRVSRVFTLDGQANVRPEVRARAQFRVQNLLRPALDAGFDVIACRNVLIYFTPGAAQQVCEHLIAALAPGGLLLLAPSDPRPPVTETLEQVRVGGTVLLRRPADWRPDVVAGSGAARPAPSGPGPGSSAWTPNSARQTTAGPTTADPNAAGPDTARRTGAPGVATDPGAPDLARARQRAFVSPHDPAAQLDLAAAFLQARQGARAAATLRGAEALIAARGDSWEAAHLRARAAQLRHALGADGAQ